MITFTPDELLDKDVNFVIIISMDIVDIVYKQIGNEEMEKEDGKKLP
jgi:hypothetical protein